MRILLLFIVQLAYVSFVFAQDDIVLDLDSIKNIKTTRYSTVNEVGVAISIGGTLIQKLPGTTKKDKLKTDKPSVMFRTVHGVLVNPHIFIGGGVGIDFLVSGNTGTSSYTITFPIFAELRQYVLNGSFNLFFSERMGGAVFINPKLNRVGGKGTSSGAFGEFMIGGRYVTGGKKLAIHFGVGYRLQHLQKKIDITDLSVPGGIIRNIKETTIKHYIPVTIGITF